MADVPAQWVDRLFDRFTAIFGAQKVAGMWAGASMPLVKQTWAEQLGRIDPDMVRAGLQRMVDEGTEWPPTLPEFVALCRRAPTVAAHQPAQLPAPVSRVAAAENLAKVQRLVGGVGVEDPLFWAKRPLTAAAVRLMLVGAQHSDQLSRILHAHFADGGVRCRSNAAMAEVVRLSARADLLDLSIPVATRQPGEDDE